jgi:uncharacterized RmlC-like cupin family protein
MILKLKSEGKCTKWKNNSIKIEAYLKDQDESGNSQESPGTITMSMDSDNMQQINELNRRINEMSQLAGVSRMNDTAGDDGIDDTNDVHDMNGSNGLNGFSGFSERSVGATAVSHTSSSLSHRHNSIRNIHHHLHGQTKTSPTRDFLRAPENMNAVKLVPHHHGHHHHKKKIGTQLSRQTIIGVGISVLLSFVIVLSGMGLLFWLSPVILRGLKYTHSLEYFKPTREILALDESFSPHVFDTEYFRIKPALFRGRTSQSNLSSIIELLDSKYGDERVILQRRTNMVKILDTDSSVDVSLSAEEWTTGSPNSGKGKSQKLSDYRRSLPAEEEYNGWVMSDKDALHNMPRIFEKIVTPQELLTVSKTSQLFQTLPKTPKSGAAWYMNKISSYFKDPSKVPPKKTSASKVPVFRADDGQMLSITSEHNGLPFHQLDHSWNLLVSGKLRWILYDSDSLPQIGFDPAESLGFWLTRNFKTLWGHQMPLEIYQEPGQVVYIPEGWYRGYVSEVKESILITQTRNLCESASSGSAFCSYKEARRRMSSDDHIGAAMFFQQALESSKDYKLYLDFGSLHQRLQDYESAEEFFRQAISQNYRNPEGYVKLIELLEFTRAKESTPSEPEATVDDSKERTDAITMLKLAKKMNVSRQHEEMQRYMDKYL